MTKRARWILIVCASAVLLLVGFVFAIRLWQMARDRALLVFCKDARPGMPFDKLIALERSDRIDESYIVEAKFKDFVDQAHTQSLEFRSQWFDPYFVCVVTHDGSTVMKVQLLTFPGFDPYDYYGVAK
jgi:hypothetical protein